VDVPMPEKKDREEIFEIHFRNKPLAPDISPAQLSSRTEGFNGAEIASACNKAALKAIRRAIKAKGKVLIELTDIESALNDMKKV